MISNKQRFYYFSFLIVFIAMAGVIIYRYNASRHQVIVDGNVFRQYTKNRFQTGSFRYNSYNDAGEKVITIKADSITVEKQKFGFFTTSLFNVAKLRNMELDLYGRRDESGQNTVAGIKKQLSGLSFKDSFSEDALPKLPALPLKAIASIDIQGISVNLKVDNSMITSISATSAAIRAKQRKIIFQGDVKVTSGEKTLKTDRLEFFPETATIKIKSHFSLETKKGQTEGMQFFSDVYLLPVAAQGETKSSAKPN
jgi:hypothetical protein